jgi:hypothetical protein
MLLKVRGADRLDRPTTKLEGGLRLFANAHVVDGAAALPEA